MLFFFLSNGDLLMSLKNNIAANYTSQVYVTAVGILILPLYIKYMGPEAYGLIGFFTMLQACFALLDLGLTPTIGRETARFYGGSMSALFYRQLFRALSFIFSTISIIGGSVLWLSSDLIATSWLNATNLPLSDVVLAVKIMAISVALRWMGGLYRGVITGSERLVWLSGFNALIATLRYISVFLSMWWYGFTPVVFFAHQFFVALIEVTGLLWMSSQLLPSKSQLPQSIGWSFKPVKPVLKFALTIAFTSAVWVLVTQTDKLVLSGILSLTEYGYFTLAVLAASGIMVIGGPISLAIMPRMARLHAEKKHDEMIQIYRKSTQLVSVVAGSAAITLVATAKPLLIAWTGDEILAEQSAPVLRLYAAGNLFLCVSAFAYYLQYALGNLRYHLIGNVGLVVILIPSIIFAANHFGGIGAGYVWLVMNALYLFSWVAYVHHKLQPGLFIKWLFVDYLKIVVPTSFVVYLLLIAKFNLVGRMDNLIYVLMIGTVGFICSLLLSNVVRAILKKIIRKMCGI